ncbi:MAG: S8 family peptidase [Planctomycetes bacterium]|nr:S8 family peptidase [Planctomycetota bacterium]
MNTAPIYRLPPWRCEATLRAEQLTEVVDWSLAAYHVPDQWKTTMGQNVRVAVLDTGIDATHPDLAAAIDATADFTGSPVGANDRQGHGTHTAGTIAARRNGRGVVGVAPECRLLVGKVLGDDGSGSDQSVAAGIDWAVAQGADIVSMSLGSPQPSPAIYAAIRRACDAGKFVVCAAGNDGAQADADTINYPGRWKETVAVAAVDSQGHVAEFSSRGPEIDIAAPGVNILSTFLNSGYARLSGTSMATPFVAGVVALMLSKHRALGSSTPLANVTDLREHLRRTATPAAPQEPDPAYGWGLIDPNKLVADDASPVAPPATIAPPATSPPSIPELRQPITLVIAGQPIVGAWVFTPDQATSPPPTNTASVA